MLKGQKMSEESRLKMSNSKKELYKSGFKPFWLNKKRPDISDRARERMLGKKLSNETKRKLSLARSGNNHPNWKQDRSLVKKSDKKHLDTRYKEWMKTVKTRDGWKCKLASEDCKGRLEAHHILNWEDHPELRYQFNNGITLCHAHHPRGRSEEKRLENLLTLLVQCQYQKK